VIFTEKQRLKRNCFLLCCKRCQQQIHSYQHPVAPTIVANSHMQTFQKIFQPIPPCNTKHPRLTPSHRQPNPNNPEINLSRDAQKGLLYLLWHATCQSNQNINNKKWVNITNTLGLKKRVGPSYGESIHGSKRIIRQRFGSGWGRGLPHGVCACFSGFCGSHRSSVRRRRRTC
jgi:hypothetical protein